MSKRGLLLTILCLFVAGRTTFAASATSQPTTQATSQPASSATMSPVQRAVRRASFAALGETKPDPSLSEAVERLQASRLTASPKPQPVSSAPAVADQSPAPEAATTPEVTAASPPATQAATTRPAKEEFASALQKIRKLPADSLPDPVALADALYRGGHIEAAGVFYDKALGQQKDDPTRAWLLFQLGNCNRTSDPEAAQGYFTRVQKEHPKCPWSLAAEMQDRLIEWRKTNKPEEMLTQVTKELGSP
jgi:tetratricopeptide (TPR) repeat protein